MRFSDIQARRGKAAVIAVPLLLSMFSPVPAKADNLFADSGWSSLASDRRAKQVGDLVTVVIYEQSSAVNSAQNGTGKSTSLSGGISGGSFSESGGISFGGDYSGRGETRRSGRMVAQLSVTVEQVLPNGDFVIGGVQKLNVNGEATDIAIRGRIREADMTSDNRILSSRIADAQINYNGQGFVSRSAKPGLITRIFNFLGLV
ncbi:flagellar basal body L-ring protein FlgH [Sphingorhabdus sp. Alg239-R122]|uniref:flagellar basal body L-ring protein FlgH n=1 Tax=Sphingorhabdus sp. Alg239-R122 TaxID=2305989 RepID=UPI0013DBFD51|nr:flagellar basal body L-ring protein FlgH [Sphingorhabdus sp. Alg239-R122]